MKSSCKVFINLVIAALLSLHPMAIAGDFYKWTDENGTIHFSDSPADVPPKYQDRIKKDKFKEAAKSPVKSKSADGSTEVKESLSSGNGEEQQLKRYEIPYKAYEGTAKRVIISVAFNNSITAPMTLDTGAPGMVIFPQLAERLGIFDEDEGKLLVMAGGIGGSVPAVRTIIDTVQVGGARDHFVPTTVTPSISDSFEGLIGMDFMSNYSINIDPSKRVLVFQEMPPKPNLPGGHDEEWWKTNFKEFASLRAAWKQYRGDLDRQIQESLVSTGPIIRLRRFADLQYKEANKLFDKLDRYAIEHAVPMNWREY
jgi:hypothetical protein